MSTMSSSKQIFFKIQTNAKDFFSKESLMVLAGLCILVLGVRKLPTAPWKSLILILSLALFPLMLVYPLFGLSLFLSTLTFNQFMLIHHLSFPKFAGILIIGTWILSLPLRLREKSPFKQSFFRMSRLDTLVLFYFTACLVSIFALTEYQKLSHFLDYSELFLFYTMFKSEIKTEKNLRAALWALIIPGAISAAVYMVHFSMTGGKRIEGIMRLVAGTFSGINIAATSYLLIAGTAFAFICINPKRSLKHFLLLSSIFIFLIYILFSFSRGTWGGLFVSVAAIFILRQKNVERILLKLALIIFSVLFLFGIIYYSGEGRYFASIHLIKKISRRANLVLVLERFHNSHFYLQKIALFTMIPQHPFFGIGNGNVTARWNHYASETRGIPRWMFAMENKEKSKGFDAHSTLLNVAVQFGIPMFFVFVGIIGMSLKNIKNAWENAEKRGDKNTAYFFKYLFATVLGFLASSYWVPMQNSLFLIFVFGIASITPRIFTPENTSQTTKVAEMTA